jgi:hypothetical protein
MASQTARKREREIEREGKKAFETYKKIDICKN